MASENGVATAEPTGEGSPPSAADSSSGAVPKAKKADSPSDAKAAAGSSEESASDPNPVGAQRKPHAKTSSGRDAVAKTADPETTPPSAAQSASKTRPTTGPADSGRRSAVVDVPAPQAKKLAPAVVRPSPPEPNTSVAPTATNTVVETANRSAKIAATSSASPAPTRVPAAPEPADVVSSVVSGVLGFFGLTPLVTPDPVAPLQPPFLAGLLQLVRRDTRYALFDRVPVAAPVQISQTADGVVTGTVGAVDPGDRLTYQVSTGPANGTVLVGAGGTYTYTPNARFAATGGTDTFSVVVDDNVRSLIQLGTPDFFGFRISLFSSTGQTSVPVTVTVAPRVAVATVGVGVGPAGVAVSPDGTRAYVANAYGNSVSVIDTATSTVIATIVEAGNFPVAVALHPDGSRVYLANAYGNSVSVINTVTQKVTASIDLGAGATPSALAIRPDGQRLYVTDANADSVSVIDTATNTVTATIGVGAKPQEITIGPSGARAYVTNAVGNSVSVIDTATNAVVATVGLDAGSEPGAVAVSPSGALLYVAGYENGTLSVIDTTTNTVVTTVDVGSRPDALAVSPDGTRIYVTNTSTDAVTVIDTATNTAIGVVAVGASPDGIALSPDGTNIYVADFADGTLSVLSTAVGVASVGAPLVGAEPKTRGFDVYNLTQYPITYAGLRGDVLKLASAPPVGTVLQPGQAAHYEVVFSFFAENEIFADFISPLGRYTAQMKVLAIDGRAQGRCFTGGGAPACSPTRETNQKQIFFLDGPGTTVAIGAGESSRQAEALNNFCNDGSPASCTFTSSRQELTYSDYRPVGAVLNNDKPLERSLNISKDESVSQSDSLQVATKVGLKLGDIVSVEIQTTYGRSWTKTVKFGYRADTPVEPYTRAYFIVSDPIFRVYGDFTIVAGNSTIIVKDVFFDTPDGSGDRIPELRVVTQPLPTPIDPAV